MINLISFQGLGSPVFNKLEAQLARAAMSLPASIGFEFGSGFAGMELVCRICFKKPTKKKKVLRRTMIYTFPSFWLSLRILAGTLMSGSEHNDEFYIDKRGRIRTRTNHSGGIQVPLPRAMYTSHNFIWFYLGASMVILTFNMQGGISNGEVLNMRIAFKPTPTIEVSFGSLFSLFFQSSIWREADTPACHHFCSRLVVFFILIGKRGKGVGDT